MSGAVGVPPASVSPEDMLQWINAHARQGIFTTDRALRILSWNRWLEEHSGRPAADMIGSPLARMFPEIEQRGLLGAYETALMGGSTVLAHSFHEYLIVIPLRHRNAERATMQQAATISPLFHGKTVVGTITVIDDVTERVGQERALKEQEERFRLIATAASDSVWDWDVTSGRVWLLDPHSGGGGVHMSVDDWWGRTVHAGDLEQTRLSLTESARGASHLWSCEHRGPGDGDNARFILNRAWIVRSPAGEAQRVLGAAIDVTAHRKREEYIKFLLTELSHRSKNLLAVIQAMSSQTARTSSNLDDFQRRFMSRVHALATSHELLVGNDWNGALVQVLVERMLAPFREGAGSRFRLEGPAVYFNAQAAQAVGLAVHELATNAVKHGALSMAGGTVEIGWSLNDDEKTFRMSWRERGGPPVSQPQGLGFGRVVIERMVAQSVGGAVELSFDRSGVVWVLTAPLARISP